MRSGEGDFFHGKGVLKRDDGSVYDGELVRSSRRVAILRIFQCFWRFLIGFCCIFIAFHILCIKDILFYIKDTSLAPQGHT